MLLTRDTTIALDLHTPSPLELEHFLFFLFPQFIGVLIEFPVRHLWHALLEPKVIANGFSA